MLLREFAEREVYKSAKYIKCVDEDGIALPSENGFKMVEVLYCKELEDRGIEFKLRVCNSIPAGWKVKKGARTAPRGFCWIHNGKSIFSSENKKTLLRMDCLPEKFQEEVMQGVGLVSYSEFDGIVQAAKIRKMMTDEDKRFADEEWQKLLKDILPSEESS